MMINRIKKEFSELIDTIKENPRLWLITAALTAAALLSVPRIFSKLTGFYV